MLQKLLALSQNIDETDQLRTLIKTLKVCFEPSNVTVQQWFTKQLIELILNLLKRVIGFAELETPDAICLCKEFVCIVLDICENWPEASRLLVNGLKDRLLSEIAFNPNIFLKIELLDCVCTLVSQPTNKDSFREPISKGTNGLKFQVFADLVFNVGDYLCQTNVVELICAVSSSKERIRDASTWFPDERVAKSFLEIDTQKFDATIRQFLLIANASRGEKKRVVSLPCIEVESGKKKFTKPQEYDSFWFDFNLDSKSLFFFYRSIDNRESREDDDWNYVKIPANLVKSIHIHEGKQQSQLKLLLFRSSFCCPFTELTFQMATGVLKQAPFSQLFPHISVDFDTSDCKEETHPEVAAFAATEEIPSSVPPEHEFSFVHFEVDGARQSVNVKKTASAVTERSSINLPVQHQQVALNRSLNTTAFESDSFPSSADSKSKSKSKKSKKRGSSRSRKRKNTSLNSTGSENMDSTTYGSPTLDEKDDSRTPRKFFKTSASRQKQPVVMAPSLGERKCPSTRACLREEPIKLSGRRRVSESSSPGSSEGSSFQKEQVSAHHSVEDVNSSDKENVPRAGQKTLNLENESVALNESIKNASFRKEPISPPKKDTSPPKNKGKNTRKSIPRHAKAKAMMKNRQIDRKSANEEDDEISFNESPSSPRHDFRPEEAKKKSPPAQAAPKRAKQKPTNGTRTNAPLMVVSPGTSAVISDNTTELSWIKAKRGNRTSLADRVVTTFTRNRSKANVVSPDQGILDRFFQKMNQRDSSFEVNEADCSRHSLSRSVAEDALKSHVSAEKNVVELDAKAKGNAFKVSAVKEEQSDISIVFANPANRQLLCDQDDDVSMASVDSVKLRKYKMSPLHKHLRSPVLSPPVRDRVLAEERESDGTIVAKPIETEKKHVKRRKTYEVSDDESELPDHKRSPSKSSLVDHSVHMSANRSSTYLKDRRHTPNTGIVSKKFCKGIGDQPPEPMASANEPLLKTVIDVLKKFLKNQKQDSKSSSSFVQANSSYTERSTNKRSSKRKYREVSSSSEDDDEATPSRPAKSSHFEKQKDTSASSSKQLVGPLIKQHLLLALDDFLDKISKCSQSKFALQQFAKLARELYTTYDNESWEILAHKITDSLESLDAVYERETNSIRLFIRKFNEETMLLVSYCKMIESGHNEAMQRYRAEPNPTTKVEQELVTSYLRVARKMIYERLLDFRTRLAKNSLMLGSEHLLSK